jgi:hypothetical protein
VAERAGIQAIPWQRFLLGGPPGVKVESKTG